MPHKHTRAKKADNSIYDLPPNVVAKPLPTNKSAAKLSDNFNSKRRKGKKSSAPTSDYGHDDTPKAFARLMSYKNGKAPRNGLDDGAPAKAQKRKRDAEIDEKPAIPKMLPGERMSEYSARVDQALPISGLVSKGKKLPGVKEHLTKHDKRLRRIQAVWRKEEAEIKEKEEEELEQLEEEEENLKALLAENKIELPQSKRGKRRKMVGEQDDGDDDPWAALKDKREKPKGLHDVVQAPPEFSAVPKEKFKVRNGAKVHVDDVPNAAGSLRRREELGEARKDIIANYRAMMRNRGKPS
ncbi:hypothetical protein EJ05DRAFT_495579 [Pseudovirgaria hyperparasitica]|uniref:Uncharacterized protein n=1 Tax=Pseudovirgaria hyperparasitica TaxID=470096 RepID=A0A6A6WKJ3_9PEZI|nr:uncharacterized protein EJ05DRAFT_495579 [Pseudovirgaria hyperparasitica]KAF2762714.1 hypothetical protein EJ05DRAFT_495579 [Pseudovirgaria hyperparasitica]